jgi:hypothetical protein
MAAKELKQRISGRKILALSIIHRTVESSWNDHIPADTLYSASSRWTFPVARNLVKEEEDIRWQAADPNEPVCSVCSLHLRCKERLT